ncbi:MAG: glycosyltransferase [Anaerolineales bacterium]|nr:glycosyltransferase [Anaerolineales bacterium]
MRITLIVPTFPKTSETFIVNKFLGLVTLGHEVNVVCSSSPDWHHFPHLLEQKKTIQKQIRLSPRTSILHVLIWLPILLIEAILSRPIYTWRYFKQGWRRFGWAILRQFYVDAPILQTQPDLIHFEFGALAVNRTYLGDLLNAKIVVSFRGYDINYVGLDQPNYYAEIWGKAHGIHCLGNDIWQRVQQRGCPSHKLHTLIAPAIDTTIFSPKHTEAPANSPILRVLSVGRLEWKKGYEYALKAIQLLQAQGHKVEYRIIGDGQYLEAIAFCRHELGLDDCVTLLGKLPQHEILEHLEWADVFLHAAVSEGFCNAVLEAQAMQVPVVTSDADGLRENVEDGVTGFVVPRRNPEAIAEKLITLQDADLRLRMGQAGRARVVSQFTLTEQIQSFNHFYSEVLSQ